MEKVFVYFFWAVGGLGMVVNAKKMLQALMSKTWTKTRATVIESDIGTDWSADSFKQRCRPTIRYRYQFGSRSYENDNFNFRIEEFSKEEAQIRISTYYPGREIDVFVNPVTPEIAVIKPGLNGWHVFNWAVCCGLFFGCLYYLINVDFFRA